MMLRKLTAEDLSAFKNVRLEALELEPQAFGDSYSVLSKKKDSYWKKELSTRKKVWYGAFDNNELVGIGSIKFVKTLKFDHIAHLSGIFVRKEYRGRGVGKLLFKTRIDEAFKNPYIRKIKLIVNLSQKNAIGLYKNFGFRVVGKMEKEFKINSVYFDAYLMELVK